MSAGSRPSSFRQQVEVTTRPLLLRLHALPRPLVPLVTVVLIAVGVFAPLPVAMVALGLVLVFVGWIAYLSWPAVPASGRVVRLLMIGLVAVLGATRF